MPTLTINTAQTFAAVLLMACGPKIDYDTKTQAKAKDGTPKWEAQCAVTYLAEPGQRAVSEVISVTITTHTDPGAGLTAPCPIEFTDLRVGVSAPEVRDGRARGGKPWYQSSGMRSSLHAGRQQEPKAA